jgi:hypothetical protein
MTASAGGAAMAGSWPAGEVATSAERVPVAVRLAGEAVAAVALAAAADVAASEVAGAEVAGTEVTGAEVTGAGRAPAPYIQVPVDWTAPGFSVIPETVTWCPWVSVSRTVNGPWPAPEAAIQ